MKPTATSSRRTFKPMKASATIVFELHRDGSYEAVMTAKPARYEKEFRAALEAAFRAGVTPGGLPMTLAPGKGIRVVGVLPPMKKTKRKRRA